MKIFFTTTILLLLLTAQKVTAQQVPYVYKPDDQKLHDTIARLDSVFFSLYNNCSTQLEAYAAFYSDSIEFYHDKGGLSTSKKDLVEATKNNICGKVTRELVKGSVEVYPIPGYGAVETGLHMFHNNQEKETGPAKVSKFIIFWKRTNIGWKISRVVSLH